MRLNYSEDFAWIQHPYGWFQLTRDAKDRISYSDGVNPGGLLSYTIESTDEGQIRVRNQRSNLSYILDATGQIETLTEGEKTYRLSYDKQGMLSHISLNNKTMRFIRDEKHRVIETQYHNDKVSRYDYDLLGNRFEARYSNGSTMTLTHDGRGNITNVVDKLHTGESLTQSYQVNAKNQVESVRFPSGIDLDVDYDTDGRPSQFTVDGEQIQVLYNSQSEVE